MNKRNILIGVGTVALISGGVYFAYTNIRNKGEIKKINEILDTNTGSFGSVEDFANVFAGDTYISQYKLKYPNLILLINDYVTGYRKEIHNAIAGAGTNEDAIKSVFLKFKDKVQLAQIAASYKKYYGENLLDALKGEMDVSDQTMKDLRNIINNLPNYRIVK